MGKGKYETYIINKEYSSDLEPPLDEWVSLSEKSDSQECDVNKFFYEIPKKIHFVWVGGPIPEKYLVHISTFCAQAKLEGYEVNLWMDKESNYHTTSAKSDIHLPTLRLRKLDELIPGIRSHYTPENGYHRNIRKPIRMSGKQSTVRALTVEEIIGIEAIGEKNFAALSDIIRAEILRQEGGIYNDTDQPLKQGASLQDFAEKAIYGLLMACQHIGMHPYTFKQEVPDGCGNDLIAASPEHEIFDILMQNIIEIYSCMIHSDILQNKRFLYSHPCPLSPITRTEATINFSGPKQYKEAAKTYAKRGTFSKCGDLFITYDEAPIEKRSDQTWLKPSGKTYFDDSEIDYRSLERDRRENPSPTSEMIR